MQTASLLHESWRSWLIRDAARVGPRWLAYVWTLVFCAAVAVGFTILGFAFYNGDSGPWGTWQGWWHWYQINLVISLCIGYSIHLLLDTGERLFGRARIRRFSPRQRSLYFSIVTIVGVSIGWPLGLLWSIGVDLRRWLAAAPANAITASALLMLLVTVIFIQFFAIKARQLEAEKRATEARLKLLQGQIEPHFLFNTLANVVSLIEADGPRARLMLESFVDYLRSSLGGLRAERHTLGEEIDLIEAYLRVIAIRMEQRLHYEIDVPEALRPCAIPALLLQPLVENAIVHGLEPKIEGGHLRVSARIDSGLLRLAVEDDGRGFDPERPAQAGGPGAGAAHANIRERLLYLYGSAAELKIEPRKPEGMRTSLVIPSDPA